MKNKKSVDPNGLTLFMCARHVQQLDGKVHTGLAVGSVSERQGCPWWAWDG